MEFIGQKVWEKCGSVFGVLLYVNFPMIFRYV